MSENLVVSFILKMVNEIVGPAKEAAHDLDSIGKAAAEAAKPVGLVGTELEDMISPARQAAKEASDTANDIARMGKLSHGALSEMEKAAQAAGLTVAGYELRLKRLAKQEADETKEARAAADALEDIVGPARDVARETEDAARAMADAARPTADLADKLDDAGDAMDATTKKGHGLKLYLGVDLVNAARMAGQAIATTINFVADLGRSAVSWISDEAKLAERMADSAKAAGISAQSYQRLSYAFDRSNLSGDTLDSVLKNVNKRLVDAQAGSKEAQAAFQSVGVKLKDATGHYQKADVVLAQVADRWATMDDGARKTAQAIKLFGDSGAEIVPLLSQGEKGLKALGDEAERMNLVLGDDAVQNSKELNASWQHLNDTTNGLKKDALAGLTPVLTTLVSHIDELIQQNKEDILKGMKDGLTWLDAHLDDIIDLVTEFGKALKSAVELAAAVGSAVGKIEDAWDHLPKELRDFLSGTVAPALDPFTGLKAYQRLNDSADVPATSSDVASVERLFKIPATGRQSQALNTSSPTGQSPVAQLKIGFDDSGRPIVKSLTSTPNLTTTVDTGSLVLP